MTSYIPATIDGSEIPADAPRSQGMTDETAGLLTEAAETYRQHVLHFHADVADRTVTLHAANAPEGDVGFVFGDRTGDVTVQITGEGESASAEHTYQTDGVFTCQIIAGRERWTSDIAVNWPPYEEQPL